MKHAHLSDPQTSTGSASIQLYAIVNATGRVIGLVEWDRKDEFDRSAFRLVLAQGAQIGWTYRDPDFSMYP